MSENRRRRDHDLLVPYLTERRVRRISSVAEARTDRLILVAENLYDPHNLSAILRTAEAFGLQHIWLTGSFPEELNEDISLGSQRWITVHREPDVRTCLEALRQRGYTVAATTLQPDAEDMEGWNPPGPTALLLGNEHEGLSEEAIAGSDARVRIPLQGFTQSLNVSVAAALFVDRLRRHPTLSEPSLSSEERLDLLDRWSRLSVPHSERILGRLREKSGVDESG